MTTEADDRERPPGRSRKVERAFGPLAFPCAPEAKLAPIAPLEPDPVAALEPAAAPVQQKARVVSSSTQRIGHGSISILAGADALAELRESGLRPERVRNFVGASGGPKWLVLHGIDRVLFPWLLQRAHAPLQGVQYQFVHGVLRGCIRGVRRGTRRTRRRRDS
jgi:hypothetical protein